MTTQPFYENWRVAPVPKAPSRMAALLLADTPPPAPEDLRGRLAEAGIEVKSWREETDAARPEPNWRATATVEFREGAHIATYEFWLDPGVGRLPDLAWERKLNARERELGAEARLAIATETQFGAEPLADFHRQAQVVLAAAPDTPVVLDHSAADLHSGDWLRDVASASVPPGITATFRIHAVSEGEGRAERLWLHTHGLTRFGLTELEMVDIPGAAGETLVEVMNYFASMFASYGMPPPGEPFGFGDEKLVWLPWAEAQAHVREGTWGRDRGAEHAAPSAVLLRPPGGLFRRGYGNPAGLAKQIDRNTPVVAFTDAETQRMAALAKERLPRFLALQSQFGTDTDNWLFLVHIGLPVDPEFESEKGVSEQEHLWFQVHAMGEAEVEATLVNQPLGIKALRAGQRGTWPLDGLSDWTIMCHYGRFDPSTIFFLERELAAAGEGE